MSKEYWLVPLANKAAEAGKVTGDAAYRMVLSCSDHAAPACGHLDIAVQSVNGKLVVVGGASRYEDYDEAQHGQRGYYFKSRATVVPVDDSTVYRLRVETKGEQLEAWLSVPEMVTESKVVQVVVNPTARGWPSQTRVPLSEVHFRDDVFRNMWDNLLCANQRRERRSSVAEILGVVNKLPGAEHAQPRVKLQLKPWSADPDKWQTHLD